MKKLILLLVGLMVFVAGCMDYVYEPEPDKSIPEQFLLKLPNGSIDPDECHQNLYSLYSKLSNQARQQVTIGVRNLNAESFSESKEIGYCFNIDYIPEKTDVFKRIFPVEYDGEFTYKNFYQEGTLNLDRFGDNDKLIISIGNYSEELKLMCSHILRLYVNINFSRDKTYNCVFDGKIKTENNTYDQLEGQVCDSYETYCGD